MAGEIRLIVWQVSIFQLLLLRHALPAREQQGLVGGVGPLLSFSCSLFLSFYLSSFSCLSTGWFHAWHEKLLPAVPVAAALLLCDADGD